MLEIDPDGAAALRAAARRLKTSVGGLMIVASAVYLYRGTGAEDLILGLPVPGRTGRLERRIPGMTTNVLPLRLSLSRHLSIEQLARQVSAATRAALRHQRYRYEDILRDLRLVDEGILSGLVVNVMAFDAIWLDDRLGTNYANIGNGPADDLEISVYDRSADGSVKISVDANPDLYTTADCEDISRRFRRVLGWLTGASPDESASRAEVLAEAERRQLLGDWNDTSRAVGEATLPELFEARVASSPDSVALILGPVRVSYEELDARASRLARALAARGVRPESLVAVVLERSVEQVVALLGVLKAGGAYLPVDPDYPPERISRMLADARPAVILAAAGRAADLPALASVPVLTGADLTPAAGPDSAPAARPLPWHPAYVIYTSGSTGQPKGVVVSHAGLASLSAAQRERFAPGGGRVLQFASPSFDASAWELVMALGSGASLVLGSAPELLPGPGLVGLVARQGVTHLTIPPAVLGTLEPGDLPTVSVLIVAGDAAGGGLVDRWAGGRLFVNAYGPTETTICATMTGPLLPGDDPLVGKPIVNTRVFVLDGFLQPVPAGRPG